MAITFVGITSGGTGANQVLTPHASVVENDLLIIVGVFTAARATPAGWTLLLTGATTHNFLTIWYKYANVTEPSVSIATTAAAERSDMLAYRDASIIANVSSIKSLSATSIVNNTLTRATANEMTLHIAACNVGAASWSGSTGQTVRAIRNPLSTIKGAFFLDELGTGITTARTYTLSATARSMTTFSINIRQGGNRYWRGGSGSWIGGDTTGTNWSYTSGGTGGATIPGPRDSVFFDQAGTYTCNMTGNMVCNNITVSAGTVSFNTGTLPVLAVTGSMSLISGTIWNATSATTFTAYPSGTSRTITTNGTIINGSITLVGGDRTYLLGSALTTNNTSTTTLTSGVLNLGGFTLTTGKFSSNNTNTRSLSNGSIILVHATASQTVLDMSNASNFTHTGFNGFSSDAAVARTFEFARVGTVPTVANGIAANLTFTGTGTSGIILQTGSYFNNLDFGSSSAIISGNGNVHIINNVTLSPNGAGYLGLWLNLEGTGTVNTNGKTIGELFVNASGTHTLASALNVQGAITLTKGTLDCSVFSLQSLTFASTGTATRSITGSGTYTISSTGFSNASAAGISITGMTISMTRATAKTFAGGGGSYSTLNQGGAGALTISGNNSFANLTATTRPSTITFTAGSTQTFADFTLSGISGSLVTINSTTAGTAYTLNRPSGITNVDFLSIRDSTATPAGSWYAGTNSTNVSGNTNWNFSALVASTVPGSNLFFFF